MVGIEDSIAEILKRVARIENTLTESLKYIRQEFSNAQGTIRFFADGLNAHRERILKETQLSTTTIILNQHLARVRGDKALRFPHRKILDFLLGQFDFEKNEFKEVHFSRLVKETHVGKNMANSYLSVLVEKGYLEIRTDRYRKFFKIRNLQQ